MISGLQDCVEVARKGWNKDSVRVVAEALRVLEVDHRTCGEVYLKSLLPVRVLLMVSQFEENKVRMIFHRLKMQNLENLEAVEWARQFCEAFANLQYETITDTLKKCLNRIGNDTEPLQKMVLENYRRNLWVRVAKNYSKIKKQSLLRIFGSESTQELAHLGFSFKDDGDYCELEKLVESSTTQEQCIEQIKILQTTFARIEKV